MVAMVVMVFGNVVLRYGFNSGITVSDEMSRYCFIWLTYIGAKGRDARRRAPRRRHADPPPAAAGQDHLLRAQPAAHAVLHTCCSSWGTFEMHELQRTNVSPVVGISMIWVYGIGYVGAGG